MLAGDLYVFDDPDLAEEMSDANDVTLGGGVIVLPGVNVGANTVVGAGAVVTKDLPPNVVAVGNPARVVRSIDEPGPRDEAVAAVEKA